MGPDVWNEKQKHARLTGQIYKHSRDAKRPPLRSRNLRLVINMISTKNMVIVVKCHLFMPDYRVLVCITIIDWPGDQPDRYAGGIYDEAEW